MIIEVELEKANTKEKERFELWGVDANKIATYLQQQPGKIDSLVHGLIREKLPQHLYPFDIKDWNFKEEK
jgi:hypothetical protein